MYRSFYIILIALILLVTCGNDRKIRRGSILTHPILKMELVEMPSPGKVEWVSGQALLKKKESYGYFSVYLGLEINADDILWLGNGATIEISFKDGTYVANKPVSEDTFFTFELRH